MRKPRPKYVEIAMLESRLLWAAFVLDSGFGENGLVPGGSNVAEIIGRRRDGQMLFRTSFGGGPGGIISLNPDGSYSSFQLESNFSNNVSEEFYLTPADRTYFLGLPTYDSYEFADQLPYFRRYKADGSSDHSFAQTILPMPGKYKNIPTSFFSTGGLKVDSLGRAVAGSTAEYNKPGTYTQFYERIYLDRVLPDGGRDTSFGDGGRLLVTTSSGAGQVFTDYLIAPDDSIYFSWAREGDPIKVSHYTATGTIDTGFAAGGTLTIDGSNVALTTQGGRGTGNDRLAIDSMGRLLVGYKTAQDSDTVFIRRYSTDGDLDTSFGSNGVTTIIHKAFTTHFYSFLQTLSGTNQILGGAGGGLFRLLPDGKIDLTFGQNGLIDTQADYLFYTLPTPDGIYTFTKIGEEYGTGRYVESNSIRLDNATGQLTITATTDNDVIRVTQTSGGIRVRINNVIDQTIAGATSVLVNALDGNDNVNVATLSLPVTILLGAGNDRLTTGDSPATVSGGIGKDTITTGAGADLVKGGEGQDSIFTLAGSDTIESGLGNDHVDSGADEDHVTNSTGADYVDLGTGGGLFVYGDNSYNDTDPQTVLGFGDPDSKYELEVGYGNDLVSIIGGTIVVDAKASAANRISALASVTAVVMSDGDDDTIVTGTGDDTITRYVGRAHISAGGGDDTIQTGFGRDTINCGPGDDVVTDFGGSARVYGGDGDDSIRTGTGRDTLFGDAGSDTLRGAGGADVIDGGFGRDLLFGSSGNDTLIGGGNNDRLYGGPGADQMYGSGGEDLFIDRRDALDNTTTDVLDGGAGLDQAFIDPDDTRTNIETFLSIIPK